MSEEKIFGQVKINVKRYLEYSDSYPGRFIEDTFYDFTSCCTITDSFEALVGTKGYGVIDEDGKNVVVWESDVLEIKGFPH